MIQLHKNKLVSSFEPRSHYWMEKTGQIILVHVFRCSCKYKYKNRDRWNRQGYWQRCTIIIPGHRFPALALHTGIPYSKLLWKPQNQANTLRSRAVQATFKLTSSLHMPPVLFKVDFSLSLKEIMCDFICGPLCPSLHSPCLEWSVCFSMLLQDKLNSSACHKACNTCSFFQWLFFSVSDNFPPLQHSLPQPPSWRSALHFDFPFYVWILSPQRTCQAFKSRNHVS